MSGVGEALAAVRPAAAVRARHLRWMDAEPFLRLLPREIVGAMEEADFDLLPRTRPFISKAGHLLVRLVWRRRSTGACNVLTWWVTGAIDDVLLDALDEAMRPELEAHA